MAEPINLLKPKTSDGWVSSVADEDIIKPLFPPEFTDPSIATISLLVKQECKIEVILKNTANEKIPYELSIVPNGGLELDERFGRIYSFKFLDGGIEHYWAISY